MTKAVLIARVAVTCGISKASARRIVDALFDPRRGAIANALRRGERVVIPGFGTFAVVPGPASSRDRSHGTGRATPNPAAVTFRAARRAKDKRGHDTRERPQENFPEPLWLGGTPASPLAGCATVIVAVPPADLAPKALSEIVTTPHIIAGGC